MNDKIDMVFPSTISHQSIINDNSITNQIRHYRHVHNPVVSRLGGKANCSK